MNSNKIMLMKLSEVKALVLVHYASACPVEAIQKLYRNTSKSSKWELNEYNQQMFSFSNNDVRKNCAE